MISKISIGAFCSAGTSDAIWIIPKKTDRYQAETLVHEHLSVEQLMGIICYGANEKRALLDQMQQAGIELNIEARPSWYF